MRTCAGSRARSTDRVAAHIRAGTDESAGIAPHARMPTDARRPAPKITRPSDPGGSPSGPRARDKPRDQRPHPGLAQHIQRPNADRTVGSKSDGDPPSREALDRT